MKTIVITGASSGIGLSCVKACLQAGHRVIATARKTKDLSMLEALGATAVNIEMNDLAAVERAATAILQHSENTIDCLFNNAGYGLQVAMEDSTWEALEQQHRVNVVAPICLSNLLLPALKPGSKIIFNSSVLGIISMPLRGPYCMSKYALEAAADAYRLELESLSIGVHVLQPGPIEANFRARATQALEQCLGNKSTRLDYTKHCERLSNPSNSPGTFPASACADIVLDIIEGRKTRSRYLVTAMAKKAAIAKRLLGHSFHYLAKKIEPLREA